MAGLLQVPFGNAMVSRLAPAMPAHAYKTYGLSMPLSTHWRPATCEEADCEQYRNGWVTAVDLASDLGPRQAYYIRHDRSRRHTEQAVSLTLVKFVFGPGQTCFRAGEHRVPLHRPPRFYVAGGDFRGNPRRTPTRAHSTAEAWCEDFAEHQDMIATAIQKG